MKKLLSVLLLSIHILVVHAQVKDTLRNLPESAALTIHKYSGEAKWGFWTGHNDLGRQQFAEKYYISGGAKVLGIICHLTGTVSSGTADNSAFNVWSVGSNKFPDKILGSKTVSNKDLDVSGKAYTVMFDEPIAVSDSFFVAFDLLDYSHHAHKDTIGVLYGPDGSRSADDLFGRNTVQVHSHGDPVWRDLATQNFTNIKTHLAIYPIVELSAPTSIHEQLAGDDFKIYKAYPNPASESINLNFYLQYTSHVTIHILNNQGTAVYQVDKGAMHGEINESIPVSDWQAGMYLYIIHTDRGSLVGKFSVL